MTLHKAEILEAIKLKKRFEKQAILTSISVPFKKNRTYAIMGESGSGKSTLMHLLAGFDVPTEGGVSVGGIPVSQLSVHQKTKRIGFVMQSALMISELTVLQNVVLPGHIIGLSDTVCFERAQFYLKAVGLLHAADWHVGKLSGGQLQRVALARALITEPDFLLADEPTGSLDHATGMQLFNLIMECKKRWGMGVIVSTHSQLLAQNMEVVFTLKNGILHRVTEQK